MGRIVFLNFMFGFLITATPTSAQQYDRHWIGINGIGSGGPYGPVFMAFNYDSISYEVPQITTDTIYLDESIAMSNASGVLQFYTNGNVVVSWNGYIMEGGKGFNEGSPDSDIILSDTMANSSYVPYTYQLIPDSYEEGVYYMLHSFTTIEDWGLGHIIAAPKMQISKIDMTANGGLGKVVYKNLHFDEVTMGAAFAVVRHGNGHDWWLVRRSPEGLYFRSTLLHRDTIVLTVESTLQGLSSDWFDNNDLYISAHNLIEASPDGSMLLDDYGMGYAKLMSFDRCSGEVSLIDTFSTGTSALDYMGTQICDSCNVNDFAFSPSGRYLYGVSYAGYFQYDLEADDILASKVQLGGVPWALDDFLNLEFGGGNPGGFGTFSLGPDGKLYNVWRTMHSVIEHPDEPGEASGYCIAADNAPVSCLGPNVPYYLFSTPHPNYRLGPLVGSGCDTILSSIKPPVAGSGYGVSALPTVASGQVEVGITLPGYGSHMAAEVQVVDMLGRVMERHRFPPYAYLHRMDVSGWPAGLFNVVLLVDGRPKAEARLVVAR